MPRSPIKKKEYMMSDLSKWIHGEMKARKMRQVDMGRLLGISQQAFGKKLNEKKFCHKDLIIIFSYFDASKDEIYRYMKM